MPPLHLWLQDSFTDDDGTTLDLHTPEGGQTYVLNGGTFSNTLRVVSNRLTGQAGFIPIWAEFLTGQYPPTQYQKVTCRVRISNLPNATSSNSVGATVHFRNSRYTLSVSFLIPEDHPEENQLTFTVRKWDEDRINSVFVSQVFSPAGISQGTEYECKFYVKGTNPTVLRVEAAGKGIELSDTDNPYNEDYLFGGVTPYGDTAKLLGFNMGGSSIAAPLPSTASWTDDLFIYYSDEPFFEDDLQVDGTNIYLPDAVFGGGWQTIVAVGTGITDPDQTVGISPGDTPTISGDPINVITTNPDIPNQPLWTGLVIVCKTLTDPLVSADYSVEARVSMNTLTDPLAEVGVVGRLDDDSGNCYFFVLTPIGVKLGRRLSGNIQYLNTYEFGVLAGENYDLFLYMQGDNIRGYLNDDLVVETVDGNITEIGCPGLWFARGNFNTELTASTFLVYNNNQDSFLNEIMKGIDTVSIRKETFDLNIVKPDSFRGLERIEIAKDLGAGDKTIGLHEELRGVEADIDIPEIVTPPSAVEILIADALGGLDSTIRLMPKFVSIMETFFAQDSASRTFAITDQFRGADTFVVNRLIEILETATMTDLATLYALLQVADQATISELVDTIRTVPDTFTFTDLLGLFQDRPQSDSASMVESIQIKRSFDIEPTFVEPDDISEVLKDKFVEIVNPRKIG